MGRRDLANKRLRAATLVVKGFHSLMMMFGLVTGLLGLAVAYAYSSVLGAVFFLAGAGLLYRGYKRTEAPAPTAPQHHASSGPITYNISSGKSSK